MSILQRKSFLIAEENSDDEGESSNYDESMKSERSEVGLDHDGRLQTDEDLRAT